MFQKCFARVKVVSNFYCRKQWRKYLFLRNFAFCVGFCIIAHTIMPILKCVYIYIYIYLFFTFELSLYYNRHGLIFLVSFQHCVPSMSVKRFSGFNVKTVLSGANCQPMHFFRQSGPVRITHGTQKGRPSSISISETWAFHPIYFIWVSYTIL